MSARSRNEANSSDGVFEEGAARKKSKPSSNDHRFESLENLYLETIDRKKLDFSFEKVCSVTLSNINIYGCLVCGKYFQGRGKLSPASLHSIDEDHHVFIGFNNSKIYILPENKLVESNTLADIKYAIFPTFTKGDLARLNGTYTDLYGNKFTPGFIGLNDIKHNSYSNVILQALSHANRVRDQLLLLNSNDEMLSRNELNKRFVVFLKKLWAVKQFKNHLSPHDLLQYIGVLSNKKFTINEQKDPRDFLLWLLNNVHSSFLLKDSKSSVFSKSLQGKVTIRSEKTQKSEDDENLENSEITTKTTKFWILSLDLPPVSTFKDGFGLKQVPQIKLSRLLEKYNGTKKHVLADETRIYEIKKFPPYLILHFNRFRDTNLEIDLSNKNRNQTIIEFPLTLEFNEGKIKYKLVSNVVGETNQFNDLNQDDAINWKIQLRKQNDEWVELENLNVKAKEKEFLFLAESYIQMWERTM